MYVALKSLITCVIESLLRGLGLLSSAQLQSFVSVSGLILHTSWNVFSMKPSNVTKV